MRSAFKTRIGIPFLVLALASLPMSIPSAQAGWAKNCWKVLLRKIVDQKNTAHENLDRFGQELKKEGWRRLYQKDLPVLAVPSDEKIFGLFKETQTSKEKWYWQVHQNVSQFPFRKITQRSKWKKAYDLHPLGPLIHGINSLLPKGKTLTNGLIFGIRGVVGYFTFRYSAWGLYDAFMTKVEEGQAEDDLDYLIDHDYRFQGIKDRYATPEERKKNSKEAKALALELRTQYEVYNEVMRSLSEGDSTHPGVLYTEPAATLALFSQPEVLKKIAPLFEDEIEMTRPEFYVGKDYLDASHLKTGPEVLHQITVLNHHRLLTQQHVLELFEDPDHFPKDKKKEHLEGKALMIDRFKDNAFYQRIQAGLDAKKITVQEAANGFYHGSDWGIRLQMLNALSVVPYAIQDGRVTRETLRLLDLENEILEGMHLEKLPDPKTP